MRVKVEWIIIYANTGKCFLIFAKKKRYSIPGYTVFDFKLDESSKILSNPAPSENAISWLKNFIGGDIIVDRIEKKVHIVQVR